MRVLLVLMALAASLPGSAQGLILPVDVDPGAIRTVVYSVQSGTVRPLDDASISAGGADADVCFDNDAFSGLLFAPPFGDEIVDWGVKNCFLTGYVTRIKLYYGTVSVDRQAGGPGASLGFALYAGTTGFGVLGNEVLRINLSGLPGTNQAGVVATYGLLIDFGNRPIFVGDGPIGWGLHNLDGATGSVLTAAPNMQWGTVDALDLYSPGPASPSTYFATGPPVPGGMTGSMGIQIEELLPVPAASSVVANGSGVNPLDLSEVQPARFNQTWIARIDLTQYPTSLVSVIGVSESPFTPLSTGFGELLINTSDPAFFIDVGFGLHAFQVMPLKDLLGRTFHVQGAVKFQGPGLAFLNGLDVTVGF